MEITSKSYLSLLYSFRGSNPSFIRDFLLMYENAERLYLSQNYRCKSNILNPVIQSINANVNRVPKNIEAFNEGGNVFYSENSEYDEICKKIYNDLNGVSAYDYDKYAILVRTNSLRMFLADMLIEHDVQVDIGNLNYSLRKNKIYQIAIGILQAIKYKSNVHFADYGYPLVKYMSKYERESYRKNFNTDWVHDIVVRETVSVPKTTLAIISEIENTHSVGKMIAILWKHMKAYYADLESKGFGSLRKAASVYRYLAIIGNGIPLDDFLNIEAAKESRLAHYVDNDFSIKIHTFHTVKGLEFDNVYMVGLNNTIIPDESRIDAMKRQLEQDIEIKNLSKEDIALANNLIEEYIEEERRLFYVAWTRAKENLTLQFNAEQPSRFIRDEIDLASFVPLANYDYSTSTENNTEDDDYSDYY